MVNVNNGTGQRMYLDGERTEAGALVGYAHLEPEDVVDPGENMKAFAYRWTHLPTGKTGIKRVACFDEFDFRNYLACWNSSQPETWKYVELTA